MSDSYVFKSIRDLSKLIRTRQVSPVELTKIYLERLDTLGPKYNAVVTLTSERALEQANRAEKEISSGKFRGPLHGVPYGAKDLLATSGGIPTTWGAEPFRNQTFDYDATVIKKLEQAGAILLAKLAMVELAGAMDYCQPNASFTGPVSNPWNSDMWAGGSSSGSAAAVAAGLVPFAIGSETWGSLLLPSSHCGVVGLRPTYGRVSRYGAMALSWSLDKLGPLCVTADDCGLVLEVITGADINDPTAINLPYRYDGAGNVKQHFRLAVLKDSTHDIDSAVLINFKRAIKVLRQIATVEEIELPDFPYDATMRIISNAESASAFDDFIESGGASELTAPEDHFGAYARTAILAQDYLKALRLRGGIAKAIDVVMSSFDALVGPTHSSVATPIDQYFSAAFRGNNKDNMSTVGNVIGLPSITVSSGFSDEGLPTGIQFMGRAYAENKILAVARAYQSLTNWHHRHPTDVIPRSTGP